MGSKPEREDETPSAGINWKLFLLVAGIIGAVFFAGMAMQGDGDSISSTVDADSPNIDIGQGSGPDNLAVAVETETPDAEPTATYKTIDSVDIKTVIVHCKGFEDWIKIFQNPKINPFYVWKDTVSSESDLYRGVLFLEREYFRPSAQGKILYFGKSEIVLLKSGHKKKVLFENKNLESEYSIDLSDGKNARFFLYQEI